MIMAIFSAQIHSERMKNSILSHILLVTIIYFKSKYEGKKGKVVKLSHEACSLTPVRLLNLSVENES